jgi:zinc transport system substrate-binding protein
MTNNESMAMNRKILLFTLFASMLALIGTVLFVRNDPTVFGHTTAKSADGKPSIVASFYPLEEFSRNVAGPDAEVTSVVSPGVEPHDYEPTPRDILRIQKAGLFVMNGAGIDPWAEKLRPELEKNGVKVIVMSEHVNLLPLGSGTGVDPHFWLDPVIANQETAVLREALVGIDPVNAGAYRVNAERYGASLRMLDRKYVMTLQSCRKTEIITSHDALRYLGKRYGFTPLSITGLSPEEEPSPKRIAELATFAKKENMRYILFETLTSPKIAETLANEVGATALVFNPVEGLTQAERASGETYLSVMTDNLANLAKAMECSIQK